MKGTWPLYCYGGGIGTLITLNFPQIPSSCVANLGGWFLWRREVGDPDQGFMWCLARGECQLYNSSTWLIKMWCPPSSQIIDQCVLNICYDYMMILIRLGFHVLLNIISFHIVYLVWGRCNLFCRSLGEEEQKKGKRKILGQRCGQREVQFLQHNNANI